MFEVPIDVYTLADLKKLIKPDKTITGSIIIRGEYLDSLVGVERITGKLLIMDSVLQNLGELREVGGDFYLGSRFVSSPLQSLGKLEKVGGELSLKHSNVTDLGKLEIVCGNLTLRYSDVTDLGNLRWVEGNVSLRDTVIQDLGTLEYVDGDLFLPKRLEGKLDLSRITVKGKIRYWNDGKEGRRKIMSKSELGLLKSAQRVPYWEHQYIYPSHDLSIANFEQQAFYRYFKDCFLNGKFLDIKGNSNYAFFLLFDLVRDYKKHQNFDRLWSQLSLLGKFYPKTEIYTRYNLVDLFQEEQDYEGAWKLKTSGAEAISLNEVYDFQQVLGGEIIDGDLMVRLGGYNHLTEFGQKNISQIKLIAEQLLRKFVKEKGDFFSVFYRIPHPRKPNSPPLYAYDSKYYKQFYITEEEFEYYKAVDDAQSAGGFPELRMTHVAAHAIFNQFRSFLRMAEDQYRDGLGMPKIGEGWISETELFYKIVKAFSQYEVINHGSPKWLGNQHLDIYIPAVNIGIEYQGIQHYEPVDYFGGEEAFARTVERDQRKQRKCEENHCVLLYVNERYDFEEVRLEIERIIRDRQG